MARLTSDLVLTLNDKVSRSARNIDGSLDLISRRQNMLSANMLTSNGATAKAGAALGMYSQAAVAAAPVALAMGFKKTVSDAADFQAALTGIRKKAGTTAAQTALLGEEIKALATSGELAVPIEEIFGAYERGAAAGLPVNELRQFALLSAKAADSFDMASTDVGNAAAGFKVGMGIPMAEMQRYFDLINGLADSGIADEKDVINFLDRAGASLKQYGISAKEAAAYGSSVLNLKMAPDVGANAFSTLTGALLAPSSKKAKTSLAGIVGDLGAFNKLQKQDPNEAILKFFDGLNKLDKFKATELLQGFVGAGFDDEILRMANGINEVRRNLKFASSTEWFGSLDKSYQMKLDGFWSKWQIMKNSLSELSIDLGVTGMPVAEAGLQAIRSLVTEVGAGLDSLAVNVDMTSLTKAKEAIGELSVAVTSLLQLGGEGSPIEGLFNRMSKTINTMSNAIGVIEDVGQGLGLLKDDGETASDRQNRRSKVVHGAADLIPPLKPIARSYDNFGNQTMTPEKRVALDRMQPAAQYDPSGTQTYREWLQVKRQRDTAPRPRPTNESAGALFFDPVTARAKDSSDLGVRTGQPATPTPRPEVSVPLPTPRPDIVGPMKAESDAAALAAEAAGQRITAAFSVTATPTISTDSIDAFIRKAAQAEAALARLNAGNAAFGASATGRTARLPEGVLNADIER